MDVLCWVRHQEDERIIIIVGLRRCLQEEEDVQMRVKMKVGSG